MTQIPKWNDARTADLAKYVGDETPVSQATVAGAAEQLETTPRSISSKLRKMGYDVDKAAKAVKAYTDAQAEALATFVVDNSGEYTYSEIAANFESGAFSPKSIQGKILSMELTEHVKPAEKPETVRTYTPEQEVLFIQMVKDGKFIEEIAAAMGKEPNSVRGKALSLLKMGEIEAFPKQEHTKGTNRSDPLADLGDVSGMTVAEITAAITAAKGSVQSERGVRTMLTRRGLVSADYDGAARKAKAAAA